MEICNMWFLKYIGLFSGIHDNFVWTSASDPIIQCDYHFIPHKIMTTGGFRFFLVLLFLTHSTFHLFVFSKMNFCSTFPLKNIYIYTHIRIATVARVNPTQNPTAQHIDPWNERSRWGLVCWCCVCSGLESLLVNLSCKLNAVFPISTTGGMQKGSLM